MSISEDLAQKVAQWKEWDQNPTTLAEIDALVAENNSEELEKRFAKRIAFGTAGLRGRMQAGISSMNTVTVAQASQGLCAYMASTCSGLTERGVCIGYDGRYNSKTFAHITARVFLSKNVPVYLFRMLVPTPFVAFCVKHLNLCGGVMITASHNPKWDNGYKVYWDSGSQIVSPHDKGIAAAIETNLPIWPNIFDPLDESNALLRNPIDIPEAYYAGALEQCFHNKVGDGDVKMVYTPMHGVGQPFVDEIFKRFGLNTAIPVPSQSEPDPDFSTVEFPNPEEGKGALKNAMDVADAESANVIIANDPDADRLAAAERQPSGEWKIFNGNEIGSLLADWVISNYKETVAEGAPEAVVINTTVSSKMLKAIADAEGIRYEETLTGFKWMGNLAQKRITEGLKFLFSYEEAIGYMIGELCLDKDGVRAAAAFGEMVNTLYRQGTTLEQHLQALYSKYGYFKTNNGYFFCYDSAIMHRIFNGMRGGATPEEKDKAVYASACGEFAVKSVRDLTTGYDSAQPDGVALLPKSSFMVTYYFENGVVITVRGSGTEPKLKYYAEISGKYEEREQVDQTLEATLAALVETLLKPDANGLVTPKR